jgi:hypothetical protein
VLNAMELYPQREERWRLLAIALREMCRAGGVDLDRPIGEQPCKPESETERTYRLFVMVRDAVFGGRTRVDLPKVRKIVGERLRVWQPWQIIATPILVHAQGSWSLPTKPDVDVLLRDGSHARTHNGQTYAARDWTLKAMEGLDGTRLDRRLSQIAMEAGVLDVLVSRGVFVSQ